jgi:hypothetical protein
MIYEENYDDISHAVKLSGVDVISHELAHQFFGDLVTCEWWSYIWLNEGFATLFEFHITDIMYPSWNTRHFFNIRKLQNAFRADARETTRSMTTDLFSVPQITAAFDTIAYDKCERKNRKTDKSENDFYLTFSWKRSQNVPKHRRRGNLQSFVETLPRNQVSLFSLILLVDRLSLSLIQQIQKRQLTKVGRCLQDGHGSERTHDLRFRQSF